MTPAQASPPAVEARFKGRLGQFSLDAAFTMRTPGVTVLAGSSGCGKTSLLRCMAGLVRLPGRLVVGGRIWQDQDTFVPTHRRALGYVFQEPSLLAHLSVRQNLLFGYHRRGGRDRIGVDEVVSLLDVADLLGRSTHRLSGGERQRVAIGRALLSQPDLLLMDEPLSSLDADSKAEILPYLSRLHDALSVPVIYVTHDRSEAARIADQVLTMRDGRIVAAAPVV